MAHGVPEVNASKFIVPTVQKQNSAQSLVSVGSSKAALYSQISQKSVNLSAVHFQGVPLVTIKNKPANPANMVLLGAQEVMLAPDGVADLVQELLGFGRHWCLSGPLLGSLVSLILFSRKQTYLLSNLA